MSRNLTITESDVPLIEKLPADQQDALRIGDHPYKVYADILGIKIGTLKSRVNRARNALEKMRADQADKIQTTL
jgi:DNA-directed RNA polymerase specialized sigma24 family protein